MAGERTAENMALISRAIQERACLSGIHLEFRVRFAPHALGTDENGKHSVFAYEYGGLTLHRPNWMYLTVDRLRTLQRTADPWRTGARASWPKVNLTDIEAAIELSWLR